MLLTDRVTRDFVYKTLSRISQDGLLGYFLAGASKPNDYGNVSIDMAGADGRGLRLTTLFRVSREPLAEDDLHQAGQARFFANPLEYNGSFYYVSNQWVDNENEASRLHYRTFQTIMNRVFSGVYFLSNDAEDYILFREVRMVSKPFLLLAGLSGTGKSQFVRYQAMATGLPDKSNFLLVPVRPDWHEPSDLLGYISRIDGAQYVVTDFLRFIVLAWLEATDDACIVKPASQMRPYWLCLDEMNLAPVEQYFADYLSVLETRSWSSKDGKLEYKCDPLLKRGTLEALRENDKALAQLKDALFRECQAPPSKVDKLWDHFLANGISIPPNLIVAGTVNMDETTHGFSRKVIDRALTFDFGEFFPNDFNDFFPPQKASVRALTFPTHSRATPEALKGVAADSDGQKSIRFLSKVNEVLKQTPFELAYRALNELLLSVICANPADDGQLRAVWDDFLMQKVLPRIEGDGAKLMSIFSDDEKFGQVLGKGDKKELEKVVEERLEDSGSPVRKTVLHDLFIVLQEDLLLGDVWKGQRPDLYRLENGQVVTVPCRTKKKIKWMLQRLKANHFTDFWA